MSARLPQHAAGAMVLVTPRVPPARNGVGDYTYVLGKELAKKGPVVVITSADQRGEESDGFTVWPGIPRWDFAGLGRLQSAVGALGASVVIPQWVPFLWGRYGITLALPHAVVALRRAGVPVVTTVHEPYVPLDTWGRRLYGPAQRLELAVIARHSAKVVATTPIFAALVRKLAPRRAQDIGWIPVCAGIERVEQTEAERACRRASMGVAADDLLVAVLAPAGSGKVVSTTFKAWEAIARRDLRARLVLIGATEDEVRAAWPAARAAERVAYTGFLDPGDVSRLLSCADLFLAPFVGGISTRNSSTIAAMEHGLPIVTTRGTMTDEDTFAHAPMAMVDARDEEAFVAAAVALARDAAERRRLRASVREFHGRTFDRALIAARWRDVAAAAAERRS